MEKVGSASFDVLGDDEDGLKKKKSAMIWDSKKHRFIRPTVGADNKKMIRTESGALLPASYKTKRYELFLFFEHCLFLPLSVP
jgi:ATP-dependent RNA helicase DDX54/DBP10